jgi:hypothetical protein
MTGHTGAVTVYRSADANAEQDATAVYNLLVRNGLDAQLTGPDAPGVVIGSWEVRVPPEQTARAEMLVATVNQDDPARADPSHDLDMVTLRRFEGTTGELEAISIRSILEANEIPCVMIGNSTLPNLAFFVNVARTDLDRAEAALAEAQAAGPAAAVEAERESESSEPAV